MVRTLIRTGLACFLASLLAPPAPATRVIDVAAGEQDVSVVGADPEDDLTEYNGLVAGDLNGDGAPDVVIGASSSDGQANGRPDAGEVHVFFGPLAPGSFDLRSRPGDLTIYGANSGDALGVGLSIGDVSGDGRADLVMGARYSDCPGGRTRAGRVVILFGPLAPGLRNLAATPADAMLLGERRDDGLGFSTAVADMNADGVGDLLAFAPNADGPGNSRSACGEGYVLFGPLPVGLVHDLATTPPDVHVEGADDFMRLGSAIGVGDVSGDGLPDLLLGIEPTDRDDPGFGSHGAVGAVHALFAPLSSGLVVDLAADPGDVSVLGPRIDSYRLGSAVMSADVDGDGIGDLVMGAWSASHPVTGLAAGAVHVLHGPLASGLSLDLETSPADAAILGPVAGVRTRFGDKLAVIDLDRDGISDLAVGAPYADGPAGARHWCGETHVIRGPLRRGDTRDLVVAPADVIIRGAEAEDHLGSELAAADLDGNGSRDLVTGAFGAAGPANSRRQAGEAYVFFLGDGNSPPTSMAGADQVVGCRSAVLEGSGSDPDGDPLTPAWTSNCPDAIFMPGSGLFAPTVTIDDACDRTCVFTLLVDDARGGSASDDAVVTFADREPPRVVTGSAGTRRLWPPSHRMACFSRADFTPDILDTCSLPVTWRFVGCGSDQPEDARGDGHFAPDCSVAADGSGFCVRTERQGTEPTGRTYSVSIVATDACGNESAPTAVATIHVPHDQDAR